MIFLLELSAFLTLLAFKGTLGYYDYASNLSATLFAGYESGILAKCGASAGTELRLDLALRQVIELDEPHEILKLNVWVRMMWKDCRLSWNPADYGNLTNIVVPYKYVWIPDLTLFDSTATEFVGFKEFRTTIYSDGSVYYNFPTILESLCPIDVRKFPYDTQTCKLVFGSWAHHGLDLDIVYRNPYGDLSHSEDHVEWNITSFTAARHVGYYGCCPEPYPDITFYLSLKRKPNFYIVNLILPSFLITSMATLGFFLPVESGEKVSLQITVMLSLAVFQLLVADSLPPSDETPLIAIYFNFSLFLVGIACLMAVIVLAIHYQGSRRRVPRPVRILFLRWLSKVACVWDADHNPNTVKRNQVAPADKVAEAKVKSKPPPKYSKSGAITLTEYDADESPPFGDSRKETVVVDEEDEHSSISIQEEWEMLAIVVDRLSCYIFILSFAVGSGIIFAQLTQ